MQNDTESAAIINGRAEVNKLREEYYKRLG
jgi:hypothetical protein